MPLSSIKMSKSVQNRPKKTPTGAPNKALFESKLKEFIKDAEGLKADYGLETGLLINKPGGQKDKFVMWPSPEKFDEIVMKSDDPGLENTKRLILHERFLKKRIAETRENLEKLRHSNRMKRSSLILREMVQGNITMNDLNLDQICALREYLDEQIRKF